MSCAMDGFASIVRTIRRIPPNTAAAGSYKVMARVGAEDATATSELVMDITGQPKLDISGREGKLEVVVSTDARVTASAA